MQAMNENGASPLILNEGTFPIIEQVTTGMPGGFFIYHADGDEDLIYANRALIQIFGCKDMEEFKELTGGVFRGMVHPEDWARVEGSIWEQIGHSVENLDYVEYRIRRKDGSIRWIEDYGHFVHTEKFGDVFYVFVEDATERHLKELSDARTAQLAQERLKALEQLEHETTALRLVHEILQSGMWSMEFNRRGEMTGVFWSDRFRAMLGYRDEADFPNVLESWSELIHPEDKGEVLREYYGTINDYSGRKIYDVEYRMLTRNRGYRWFRATGKLSRRDDGTPITYVGMFVDITQRKQKDEELERQRRLLEDALAQAQQSNRAKTAFLNNMSHDIRTPMNAIIGFTNLAAGHMDDREQLKGYLEKISVSSNHLLSLINDVLDMSRIESGKVCLEEKPCRLDGIVDDLGLIVREDIRAKGLDYQVDMAGVEHRCVLCDRTRLSQVLLNILSNAIKFTPAGGKISLRISEKGAMSGLGQYEFRVEDTGIGMSPDFVQHIFEPFERERTSTVSGIQGTGLGMTITKSTVDMMHGEIRVESQQGKGSAITVRLMFCLTDDAACEEPPRREAPWTGMGDFFQGRRVLLAEDNDLNQEIAATILEEAGFAVDVAADGAQAVEKVKGSAERPYDLVLMDLQMPVLDGYGAARAIRALDDPALAGLPIVAMTANAFEEDRRRVLEAGMDGHLGKPIEIEKLMDTLRDVIAGRKPGPR